MIERFAKWWAARRGWVPVDARHLEDMDYCFRVLQRQCGILETMGIERVARP
jgi:hypothetical protein